MKKAQRKKNGKMNKNSLLRFYFTSANSFFSCSSHASSIVTCVLFFEPLTAGSIPNCPSSAFQASESEENESLRNSSEAAVRGDGNSVDLSSFCCSEDAGSIG